MLASLAWGGQRVAPRRAVAHRNALYATAGAWSVLTIGLPDPDTR